MRLRRQCLKLELALLLSSWASRCLGRFYCSDGDHFDGDLESEKTDDMSEDDEKEVDGKAAIVSEDT